MKMGGIRLKKLVIIALVFIFAFTGFVLAEEGQSGDDTNTEKSKQERLVIKTGHLHHSEGRIEGTDGITMIKGDVKINATRGIYFDEEEKAEVFGNVILDHDKGQIKSKEMIGWIKQDKYIFKKEVKLVQELDDGQFILEAPYLELLSEDNSFQARQGVVIEYNDRTLKGDDVDYNDEEQTLGLSGNVYIEEKDGDWVKSNKAIFYLETEEFDAEGNVELEIDISTEE